MKRLITLPAAFVVFFSAMLLASCDRTGNLEIDAVPFQTKEEGHWGMVEPSGKEDAPTDYKNCPTIASDGRYWVPNSKGYWELYATDKTVPVNDDEYRYVTLFRGGKAIVAKRDNDVTVINKDGEQVGDLSKVGEYKPDQFSGFNGEVVVFSVGEKVGVCNLKGEVIVKPVYSVINEPRYGKIVATDSLAFNSMIIEDTTKSAPKGNVVVFDYKGKELLKLSRKKYSMTGEGFYKDYIAVAKERKDSDKGEMNWGIVNIKGEEIVKPSKKYSYISEIGDGIFSYYDGENWGVSTFEGEKVLAPKFVSVTISGEYIIASQSESGGEYFDSEDLETRIYDLKGEPLFSKKYMQMAMVGKNIIAQSESDRWEILDMKGERIENAPRIYNVNLYNVGDYFISTDKIDIKKFVKELDFTAGSLDGLTFSSTVQQSLKRQAETYSATNTPKASDYNYTDEVQIYRRIDGCPVTEIIKYPTNLSHQTYREQQVIDFWVGYTYYYHINKVPIGYSFTTSKPKWLGMSFDNYGILRGKLKTLYKALCDRFATMGTETESSSAATLFKLSDGHYAIVYLEPHNVIAKWGNLGTSERNVYRYSGNKEDLSIESIYEEIAM